MTNDEDFKPSRRAALKAGLAVTGIAAFTAATTRRAVAQDDSNKVAKEAVQYQDQPKDGQKCSMCVNWQPPNACVIVAGNISPEGYCLSYAPKQAG